MSEFGDNTPGDDPRIIDLYKLAVEMADRVSSRRATANAFFLTVQTTLVAVIGLANSNFHKAPWWTALAIATAGVVLSLCWWLQLRSYRDLNNAKFTVINQIELDLPVKVFHDEWAILKPKIPPWRLKHYAELGTSERVIPGVFAAIYLLLLIGQLSS